MALRGALLLACAALVATGGAHAGKVYRWTDRAGVVHYGDPASAQAVAPAAVSTVAVRAEPGSVARLRLEADGDGVAAWVDNQLAGPIEVRLRQASGATLQAMPPLPARATVPALSSVLVSRMAASGAALQVDVTPGTPNARPRDVEYLYPLRTPSVRVEQGFGGHFSHSDAANRHAVDFAATIGTQVVAARDGVVMQVENDFSQGGLDGEEYGGRANFVRILHDDGGMALYAHLQEGGVMVRSGQRVRAGQLIGLSGNTGFSAGPHLHFVVQVNRGMQLQSVPFRMFGPQGILRFTEVR